VSDEIARPAEPPRAPAPPGDEWLLGEALTALYVGLGRFRRGERLAAARLIQGQAVDRALELLSRLEPESSAARDPFAPERRFERRYPRLAGKLPRLLAGYERSPEAARALLDLLEREIAVDAAMAAAIRRLCDAEP
jgi:lincosamide nucleotidyltransferase B/F